MEYLQTAKDFTMNHFSSIVLFVGFLLIGSNTLDMGSRRNAADAKDKYNTAYNLNVAGIVFLSLFVINEYVIPGLSQTTSRGY